jgi:hypothetical protein
MAAVLPSYSFQFRQPKVRLVDERRGLQTMTRPLAGHTPSSDLPQLVLN